MSLTERLVKSGDMLVSDALARPEHTKRVLFRDGQTMTADGPFAEVKEHLAGFYPVECDTVERAVEHAARIPEAACGTVEVCPYWRAAG